MYCCRSNYVHPQVDVLQKAFHTLPHELIIYILSIWKKNIMKRWDVIVQVIHQNYTTRLCANGAIRISWEDKEIILRMKKWVKVRVWLKKDMCEVIRLKNLFVTDTLKIYDKRFHLMTFMRIHKNFFV